MRKNKMMRTASALLVATLLTTSIISGTFAKYTTQASGSDTARVAKWGVTVTASGNLFGTDYASNSAAENKDSIVATSTNVSTATGDTRANIVAPGTKNDKGFTVEIKGTPEVAYGINATDNGTTAKEIFLAKGEYGVMVEATGLNAKTDITKYYTESSGTYTTATGTWDGNTKYYELIDKATVNDENGYYPITWTVKETGNATKITATRLNAIATAMNTGITAGTHNANVASDASYTLTWEWKFEEQNDGADTILGDLQAGDDLNGTVVKADSGSYTTLTKDTDYSLDVAFGMKVTVTQVN